MFLHQNIHKYSWTPPVGKTHNQIDHILIEGRWHSSVLVQCFMGDDCDIDHCLVVAKFKERLAGNIQEAQKFDVESFKLRKLNELEVRKKYQINISNRSAVLENLIDSEDINRAWENIKDNIKTSALRI